jgi:predicted metal-dependent hydrolase
MIDYNIIRSNRRKSIALQVKGGELIVRAPQYVADSYIQQLILKKELWIEEKLQIQNSHLASQKNHTENIDFSNNGSIWINGHNKKVLLLFSHKSSIENSIDEFKVTLLNRYKKATEKEQNKAIKRNVEVWLKEKATKLLISKVDHFSHELNLFPSDIKVRQYKARWGSCNSRGQLSFNYLLLMTPDWVIDYVVVHELCHLKYLNHSNHYWLFVEQSFPRYKEAKQWLKLHQNQLSWPKV